MSKRIGLISILIFVLVILLFLIRSVSVPDLFCDEVSYITQAYSLSFGKVLFIETTLMHMGAVALAPFFWIYRNLCGSTEGLWLFSRIIFIFFNLSIGLAIFKVFRQQYAAGFLFGVALCCGIFVAYSPVLYYDSVGDFGLTLGSLCFFQLWQRQHEPVSRLIAPSIGAGLLFSLMTFAYPSMVVLVAYFGAMLFLKTVFDIECGKKKLILAFYLCGGLIAITAFVIYVQQYMGFTSLINKMESLASSSLDQSILWSSDAPPRFSFARLLSFVKITVFCFAYLGLSTILCFSFVFLGWVVFRPPITWRLALLISLAASPFVATFLKEPRLAGIVATYYSFWSVPMFLLTRNKTKITWTVVVLLLIPCLLAHLVYGMTATGPGRFIQGHYLGILAFLLIAPNFCSHCIEGEIPIRMHSHRWTFFTAMIALSLAFSYFMRSPFSYTSFPKLFTDGTLIEQGVLRGMFVQNKHANYATTIENLAQRYSSASNTVFWGDYHKYGYLCQTQSPCVVNEWAPTVSIRKDGIRALLSRLAYDDSCSYDQLSTSWGATLAAFTEQHVVPDYLIVYPLELDARDAQAFLSRYEKVSETTNYVVMTLLPFDP